MTSTSTSTSASAPTPPPASPTRTRSTPAITLAQVITRFEPEFLAQYQDRLLMAPGQAAQFLGQREGDQEVRARQQRLRLALNPALTLEVLAVRAASMPAGMRHQALLATTGALGQHLGAETAAAGLHGLEGFELAGQQTVLVLGQELRLEAGDDVGQRDRHLTAPQPTLKRLIRPSMRWLASASV